VSPAVNTDYDIVIIGGGMVGATLACALGQAGIGRIAVVEAHAPDTGTDINDGHIDIRVSAVTQASARLFQRLHIWDAIPPSRISPFREMHVWDATGRGEIHFDSADIGEPSLGYIIENSIIQSALFNRLQSFDTIDWICPASLSDLQITDDKVNVHLDNGRELSTKLIVGADGHHSAVRDKAGIKTHGWEYQQTAVVATITPSGPHSETAWQRFLPDGPLAFLPLADGQCSIVWSTTPDNAKRLLAMNEADFLNELQQTFGDKLGKMQGTGPRAAFPLRLCHADKYVIDRLALIGDAAHTVHPLAGQGVNLGFMDAAALAGVISEAHERGKDVGGLPVLRRYERGRKGDNLGMMMVMDGFKRLFGSHLTPVRWLRNAGLSLTNSAWPIKNLIMRQAMGLARSSHQDDEPEKRASSGY